MKEHPIRPRNVAAAAVVIGGVFVVAFPQYALSIVQIVFVAGSVVAGIYALEVSVPTTGWMSPFKWMSPFSRRAKPGKKTIAPDEVQSIRSKLTGWRQPVRNGPPMPPEALNLLRPLIRAALDLESAPDGDSGDARGGLSPITWGVLTSDQTKQPYWFQMHPPNRREVAEAVHHILDELEGLSPGNGNPQAPFDPSRP